MRNEAGPSEHARVGGVRGTTAVVVLVSLGVWLVYWFFATAGSFTRWSPSTEFYDLQAEGFRHGQLSLSISPPATLAEARNPYDPKYLPLWQADASLYRGRYFLYFGPFPALAQAAIKGLFGIHRRVGDQYAAFAADTFYLAAGALLLLRIWRQFFAALPRVLLALSVAAFGLAHPNPFLVASGAAYEAAITGAQACLLAGVALALGATAASTSARCARRSRLAAGVLWAIALAWRVSVAPAVVLLVALTVVSVSALATDTRQARLRASLELATPGLLVLLGLLLYNELRFDDWLEFGVRNQLTTHPFQWQARYVAYNVYSYLFRPMHVGCRFPYLVPIRSIGAFGFPRWLKPPASYTTWEPLVGCLLTLPLAWLAPCAIWIHARGPHQTSATLTESAKQRGESFVVWAFVLLATVTGLPTLGQHLATTRYQGDTCAGVTCLGILAIWFALRHVQNDSRARALVLIAGSVALAASVGLGALLGITSYDAPFRRYNAPLFEAMTRSLSVCERFQPPAAPASPPDTTVRQEQ